MDLSVSGVNLSFGIRVSKSMIDVGHNYYNYGQLNNRLKNVCDFNQKLSQYATFGYDNYTIEYVRKSRQ